MKICAEDDRSLTQFRTKTNVKFHITKQNPQLSSDFVLPATGNRLYENSPFR